MLEASFDERGRRRWGRRYRTRTRFNSTASLDPLAWPTNRMDESERPGVGQTNQR